MNTLNWLGKDKQIPAQTHFSPMPFIHWCLQLCPSERGTSASQIPSCATHPHASPFLHMALYTPIWWAGMALTVTKMFWCSQWEEWLNNKHWFAKRIREFVPLTLRWHKGTLHWELSEDNCFLDRRYFRLYKVFERKIKYLLQFSNLFQIFPHIITQNLFLRLSISFKLNCFELCWSYSRAFWRLTKIPLSVKVPKKKSICQHSEQE